MLLKLSPQDFLHSLLSKLPSIIRILRIDSQSTVSCEVVKPKTFQFPDRILLPSAFVYPFLRWVPFRREGAEYLRKIKRSKKVATQIFVNLNTCHVMCLPCSTPDLSCTKFVSCTKLQVQNKIQMNVVYVQSWTCVRLNCIKRTR